MLKTNQYLSTSTSIIYAWTTSSTSTCPDIYEFDVHYIDKEMFTKILLTNVKILVVYSDQRRGDNKSERK